MSEPGEAMRGDAARDWEDVRSYTLEEQAEVELLARQTECTFIWLGKDGHPMGVVMNYLAREGRFWLTATEGRPRIAAVRRDPRVSIAITSKVLRRSSSIVYGKCCNALDMRSVALRADFFLGTMGKWFSLFAHNSFTRFSLPRRDRRSQDQCRHPLSRADL